VRVYDRQPEYYRKPIGGVDYRLHDFGNRAALSDALRNVDMVFHLICTTVPKTSNDDPVFDVMSNVLETIFLLEQCVQKRVKKIIFLSSGGAVYGRQISVPVAEGSPKHPISSYGITKLTIEKYLYLFHHLYGLKSVVIRPSNPYGERQNPLGEQGVIAVFLGKIAKGLSIDIWGDGNVIKDYIYIGDLISGICKAAFTDTEHHIFNMGSGIGHSINDVVRIMNEKVDHPISVNYLTEGMFDVTRIFLDITRAKEELRWKPAVSLEDGIRRTWEFIKTIYALPEL
jgi:UDP-glucose 4-epimerase